MKANIKVEPLRFGFYNCYLLTSVSGSVLVDTAMPNNRSELLERLQGVNLKLILLTHGHLDHVGNAAFLSKNIGVPIAMSEADYPLILGAKMVLRTGSLITGIIKLFMKLIAGRHKIEPFSPVFVKDGDSLLDYGIDGKILSLPGHTKGSIGLLLDGGGLISGDATNNIFYEDKHMLVASVSRILAMRPTVIYPGHGETQTAKSVAEEFSIVRNKKRNS